MMVAAPFGLGIPCAANLGDDTARGLRRDAIAPLIQREPTPRGKLAVASARRAPRGLRADRRTPQRCRQLLRGACAGRTGSARTQQYSLIPGLREPSRLPRRKPLAPNPSGQPSYLNDNCTRAR